MSLHIWQLGLVALVLILLIGLATALTLSVDFLRTKLNEASTPELDEHATMHERF